MAHVQVTYIHEDATRSADTPGIWAEEDTEIIETEVDGEEEEESEDAETEEDAEEE